MFQGGLPHGGYKIIIWARKCWEVCSRLLVPRIPRSWLFEHRTIINRNPLSPSCSPFQLALVLEYVASWEYCMYVLYVLSCLMSTDPRSPTLDRCLKVPHMQQAAVKYRAICSWSDNFAASHDKRGREGGMRTWERILHEKNKVRVKRLRHRHGKQSITSKHQNMVSTTCIERSTEYQFP